MDGAGGRDGTAAVDRERHRRSRRRNLGSSLVFGALAVVLAVIAFVATREDSDAPQPAPVPTAAGANQLINVKRVLEAQDLTVDYGRTPARTEGITQPGQALTIGEATVYVFIFDDVAEREAATAALDPTTLLLTSPSGQPLAGPGSPSPTPRVAQASNVLAVLVGGDADLATKVDAAIGSLI